MSLRQAAQRALEALVTCCEQEWRTLNNFGMKQVYDEKKVNAAIAALHAALAEPEQNPFGGDAERYARKLREWRESDKAIFTKHKPQTTHWEGCEAVHPECRKPEQEPDGISWLKRDNGYFTAPTPRKPLTEDEIVQVLGSVRENITGNVFLAFARAIERAHGIGEQHE